MSLEFARGAIAMRNHCEALAKFWLDHICEDATKLELLRDLCCEISAVQPNQLLETSSIPTPSDLLTIRFIVALRKKIARSFKLGSADLQEHLPVPELWARLHDRIYSGDALEIATLAMIIWAVQNPATHE